MAALLETRSCGQHLQEVVAEVTVFPFRNICWTIPKRQNGWRSGHASNGRASASPADEEEIRHVDHPLRHAPDVVCQHRELVSEVMAKHRSYPRLSTTPPVTMTSPPPRSPKGYPLCVKGDIHFAAKGISTFGQRGYPFSRQGDIHFHARGISTFRQRGYPF